MQYVRAKPPAETRSAVMMRIENNWALVRPWLWAGPVWHK